MLTSVVRGGGDSISVRFENGRMGVVQLQHLLKGAKYANGESLVRGNCNWDSLRASADGLLFDAYPPVKPGHQAVFETISISAEQVEGAMNKSDSGHELLHFGVQGQFGPMTLTFKPLGKAPTANSSITEELATKLSLDEVQRWYTERGWPKAGIFCTNIRGAHCGLFQLV